MTWKQNIQKSVEVSVVFPAYNEVDYIEPAVEKTTQTLREFTDSFELMVPLNVQRNLPKNILLSSTSMGNSALEEERR
jgi:hypothetical protein